MGMNVVNSGDRFQIYGEGLKTYKKLPLGTYEVIFNKMTGFYLTTHNDLNIQEEKIYGSTPTKVEKVLKSFNLVNRNFGVILSGKKGIGKSLFARQLAVRAKDYNLPLIIVSEYVPGIASFLSSIEQEVIVLFDEFEKTFAATEEFNPQEEMLSLFDGIDDGKKLFIITCNNVDKLNSFLINRPGRFHYHFILGNPNPEEIKEYMVDKLLPEHHSLIRKIVNFSMAVDLTYDMLRAIAFEINNGFSLEETLMDLNISKEGCPEYILKIEFADGTFRVIDGESFNIHSEKRVYLWSYNNNHDYKTAIRLTFSPSDIVIDYDNNKMTLDPSKVDTYIDEGYFDLDREEDVKIYEYLKDLKIKKISVERKVSHFNSKYVI